MATWEFWWFPGTDRLLEMIAVAFWWILAILIAVIPFLIVGAIFWQWLNSRSWF